jgi:hypothetical protein
VPTNTADSRTQLSERPPHNQAWLIQ